MRRRSTLTIGTAAAAMLLTAASAQALVVDFNGLTPGTKYGDSFGNNPGDTFFTENGVDVVGRTFELSSPSFTAFNRAEVGNAVNGGTATLPQPLSYDNISTAFQFPSSFGGNPPTQVSFQFQEFGGESNFAVNGSAIQEPAGLINLNGATIGGASVSVTQSPITGGVEGVVTVSGTEIDSLLFGGQEVAIDNVEAVPEPASLALLGVGGLALLKRRRHARA